MIHVVKRHWIVAQKPIQRSLAQLTDVSPYSQAMLLRSVKNSCRVIDGEGSALGKHIHKLGKLSLGRLRDHLLADQLDVLARAATKFLRHDMSAEQSWDQRSAPAVGSRAYGFEGLQF